MSRIFGILGLVLTLATMLVAPAQEAYAAVSAVTAPVMKMDDGAPCAQKSCAKMSDCAMALSCLPGFAAVATQAVTSLFQPAIQTVRFTLPAHPTFPSLEGGGLRRPPKA